MPNPDGNPRLTKLRERLNSNKKNKHPRRKASELHEKKHDVRRQFKSAPPPSSDEKRDGYRIITDKEQQSYIRRNPVKTFFFASLAFFFVAGSVAALVIFGGPTGVSVNNVAFDISSPSSVKGGEPVTLSLEVTNRNQVPLQQPTFLVQFPEGTREPESLEEITNRRITLEPIGAGQTATREIPIAFFGESDSQKTIESSFQYSTEGSSGIVVKEDGKTVTLASSPLALDVDLLRRSASDQSVELNITLASNASEPVEDITLRGQLPSDFSFQGAEPSPEQGQNVWRFESIAPGESREITLRGRIQGITTEKKVFRFETGITDPSGGITVAYDSQEVSTEIEAPFALVDISAGDAASEGAVNAASELSGNLDWRNNSDSILTDLEIVLDVSGDIIKRETLIAQGGFYDSGEESLIWNTRTRDRFDTVGVGRSGQLDFQMGLHPAFSSRVQDVTNPEINFDVTIRGNRVSDAGVDESLEAFVSETLKVNTAVRLSSRIVHSDEPFSDAGPIPPEVDETTEYTVFWSTENSFNDVEDAVVSATLPAYASWEGRTLPENENISYNQSTGEVTWRLGTLSAEAGGRDDPRRAAFQISLEPSLSQLGDTPDVISGARFEGTDAFTGSRVTTQNEALTTSTSGGDRDDAPVAEGDSSN